MANINVLDIIYDLGETTEKTSTQATPSAGAASFTVPVSKAGHSHKLYVNNTNTDVIARVKVKAGDGIRSCLGDLDTDIAVSKAALIDIGDTMRFVTKTTQSITVQLVDTSDTALTATPLAAITTLAIRA